MEDKNTNLRLDLEGIQADFELIGTYIKEFSDLMISQGISNYPIFIAHFSNLDIGKPIFNRDEHKLNWNYNASFVEEFIKKGILESDKTQDFLKNWGDAKQKACILMMGGEENKFVFIPLV